MPLKLRPTRLGHGVYKDTVDYGVLLALYELPAEDWDHLRTTNSIESVLRA